MSETLAYLKTDFLVFVQAMDVAQAKRLADQEAFRARQQAKYKRAGGVGLEKQKEQQAAAAAAKAAREAAEHEAKMAARAASKKAAEQAAAAAMVAQLKEQVGELRQNGYAVC
jgi:hypothetical protein